ncbi:hypothetical protein ACFO26_00645 [Lactococcus nasutitermitis]|uniref:DUF4064 domain-containing protein n=1 Tax=Lactococcus nasutitermitis TaxID=1652957 RepID=A0ABV9JAC8_9LACT|nr:hypothetical protein [Lactococcus nasutitermitis]
MKEKVFTLLTVIYALVSSYAQLWLGWEQFIYLSYIDQGVRRTQTLRYTHTLSIVALMMVAGLILALLAFIFTYKKKGFKLGMLFYLIGFAIAIITVLPNFGLALLFWLIGGILFIKEHKLENSTNN